MNILIKGAGDLATGIACELYRLGHQIVMTELPVPLTVRRTVAMSRAVYESRTVVEGIQGVLAKDIKDVRKILKDKKVAVLVDEGAKIRTEYKPDVLIDAILAKKNTGTSIGDAPFVIGAGPGFSAGADCHCVIETMRGDTLGQIIWNGSALANTGIPGEVGGYTRERLIRAAFDGTMEPKASIGDVVKKGQMVAVTGGRPVYAQMSGMVRGMLQAGVDVTKGMKIGDIDSRINPDYCTAVSDKASSIGKGAAQAVNQYYGSYAVVVLAAGSSSRFGGNKLLAKLDEKELYCHLFDTLRYFPDVWKLVVTGCEIIRDDAIREGMAAAQNKEPDRGISHSMKIGLKMCMEFLPHLRGVLFTVCDQPRLKAATLREILNAAKQNPGKIIRAASNGRGGNPVLWDIKFADRLFEVSGDEGGRQIMRSCKDEIILVDVDKTELKDIDKKTDLTEMM